MKNEGPVVIGKLYGWQELKLRIKQNKQVVGPKLNAECFLGSCSLFLTPHQVSILPIMEVTLMLRILIYNE